MFQKYFLRDWHYAEKLDLRVWSSQLNKATSTVKIRYGDMPQYEWALKRITRNETQYKRIQCLSLIQWLSLSYVLKGLESIKNTQNLHIVWKTWLFTSSSKPCQSFVFGNIYVNTININEQRIWFWELERDFCGWETHRDLGYLPSP